MQEREGEVDDEGRRHHVHDQRDVLRLSPGDLDEAVGEETGALDEMLDKIADFYDQEVEATVDALTSLIEPILIVVMGICVGGMIISLYLPMFNIIKLIK